MIQKQKIIILSKTSGIKKLGEGNKTYSQKHDAVIESKDVSIKYSLGQVFSHGRFSFSLNNPNEYFFPPGFLFVGILH